MIFIFVEFETEHSTVLINLPNIVSIKEIPSYVDEITFCSIGTIAGPVIVKHTKEEVMAKLQSAMQQANTVANRPGIQVARTIPDLGKTN